MRRSMRGVRGLLLALAFGLFGSVGGHSYDKRVESFIVTGESKDSISVSLPRRDIECVFDYEAGRPALEMKDNKVTRVRAEDVAQRLNGQCATALNGYWNYEVCIGGNIRQYHGADSYLLGAFSRVEGKILKYDNGLICDITKNPRKVDISLACSDALGLQMIAEPSTCVYTMTIITPEVCPDPSYPKLNFQSGDGGKAIDDGHETWVLQVREIEGLDSDLDGGVVCAAHSTDVKLAGSRLAFGSFAMRMHSENQTSTLSNITGSARTLRRVPLADDEIAFGVNGITQGPGFNGKLGYLELSGVVHGEILDVKEKSLLAEDVGDPEKKKAKKGGSGWLWS